MTAVSDKVNIIIIGIRVFVPLECWATKIHDRRGRYHAQATSSQLTVNSFLVGRLFLSRISQKQIFIKMNYRKRLLYQDCFSSGSVKLTS